MREVSTRDPPANGVASGGIKAGRDDDEIGAVLMSDGDNDMIEGRHIVAVAHAAHGPGHIHCEPLPCALAHLLNCPSAGVEVAPVRTTRMSDLRGDSQDSTRPVLSCPHLLRLPVICTRLQEIQHTCKGQQKSH